MVNEGMKTKSFYQILRDGEEIDQAIINDPDLQESRRELESTLLNLEKYKYGEQFTEIQNCLKESFGDYLRYIRINNGFLLQIHLLIDSKHTGVNFENERNNITSYFIEYGAELYDKMEEIISLENPKLNKEEIQLEAVKRVNIMEEKFVCLLLESVKYIPNKE